MAGSGKTKQTQSWADSSGAGREGGSLLGLSGAAGEAVANVGTILIVVLSPLLTHMMCVPNPRLHVQLGRGSRCRASLTRGTHRRYIINRDHDANLFAFGSFLRNEGLRGLWRIWPMPWGAKGLEAWAWFIVFGVGQAAMQIWVPGKTFHGPISPKGNIPIYKVRPCQFS
jgi:hypothetical protein